MQIAAPPVAESVRLLVIYGRKRAICIELTHMVTELPREGFVQPQNVRKKAFLCPPRFFLTARMVRSSVPLFFSQQYFISTSQKTDIQ